MDPWRLFFAKINFPRIIPVSQIWLCITWQPARQWLSDGKKVFLEKSAFYFEWRYEIFSQFQQFLDVDVTLPADKVSSLANAFFAKLNNVLLKLKSLLLVENAVESVKVNIDSLYN